MKKTCETCYFWTDISYEDRKPIHECSDDPDETVGKCHRYPPQIDPVYAGKVEDESGQGAESMVYAWYQPLTRAVDWCGEWIKQR